MTETALSPESALMARAWQSAKIARTWHSCLARVEKALLAEASSGERYPAGAHGTPENDLREMMTDATSDLVAREIDELLRLPAPDLAAVAMKLRLSVRGGLDPEREHVELCLLDVERLSM